MKWCNSFLQMFKYKICMEVCITAICSTDLTVCWGSALSGFASPAIKTALIPNTNVERVKHKHGKLLTNALALGVKKQTNHMPNKQCTNGKLIQQMQYRELALFPQRLHDKCEYDDNWRQQSTGSSKKQIWTFSCIVCVNDTSILCITLTSGASCWHPQALV